VVKTIQKELKTSYKQCNAKGNKTSPKSEHRAGDLCISVVKTIITHSSPDTVVEDLETSSIRWSVVTSKSRRHYITMLTTVWNWI